MPDGDDLLQKADALMRRHRVEDEAAEREEAEAFEPGASDVDVPVLTDIVDEPPAAVPPGLGEEAQAALAGELEAWLDEQLPQHVMRVLDGLTDQLILQVSAKAKSELLPRLQAAVEAAAKAATPSVPRDEA